MINQSAAKKFFTAHKVSNQSWRQVTAYLNKQARKFATGDSADEVRAHFVTEALIQMMPIETAAYVRERAPTTPEAAADLAANHFLSHGVNQFNWETDKSLVSLGTNLTTTKALSILSLSTSSKVITMVTRALSLNRTLDHMTHISHQHLQ